MKKEGYITIYLSLITAVMLVFIITLTEATRCQTIRFQTECVMDMGMTSIFAEYNRELLAQYGLLGIDTSYGKKNAKEDNTKHHLLEYMNKNFVMPGLGSVSNYKDMTGVHADNAQLTDVSFLSDENGNVLKYQIVNYMKEKTGLSYVDSVMSASSFLESDNKYRQLENDKDSSFGQVNEILNELNAQREEEQEEISIENPADQVERLRNSLLLDMAIADGSTILRKEVVLSNYISHREDNLIMNNTVQENRDDKHTNSKRWRIVAGIFILGLVLVFAYLFVPYLHGYALYSLVPGVTFMMLAIGLLVWKLVCIYKENDSYTYDELQEPVRIEEYFDNVVDDVTVFFDQDEFLQLKWKEGHFSKEFILDEFPVTVGKMQSSVQMLIEDASISRLHARLRQQGNTIYLQDLDSTNGTYVNGKQLFPGEEMIIKRGDEIQFGKIKVNVV